MDRKHYGYFFLLIPLVVWTRSAGSEALVSGSIRGVSVEEIVSLDSQVRFDAMNRLIEAYGGRLSVAERNWNDGLWRPSLKDGFSLGNEAGWNWDWKPLRMNQCEIDKLMLLAKTYSQQPDLRGLTVEEKKFIVHGLRKDTFYWTQVGSELRRRILARIPDQDVLFYLLIHCSAIIQYEMGSNPISHDSSFARKIYCDLLSYKLSIEGDLYYCPILNSVLYAIILSQAFSVSDFLDGIANHYDRMYGKWSGMSDVFPEKTVRHFLAYLLVGKAMAETSSLDDTQRIAAIQSLLTSAKLNSNLPFAQEAESILGMAVRFAERKTFQ